MNEAEKLKLCVGCEQDFYNDKNPMGVKRCWHLATAKLVRRVRVGLWQRPPWNQEPVRVFHCRHERGNVLMSVESRDANNRACEESIARERASGRTDG